MARQLTLDLGYRPALGRDDFMVAPSNAAAVAVIDQWPQWPTHGVVLVGPPGSGKSHLVNVWQAKSGGQIAAPAHLDVEKLPGLFVNRALALENVQSGNLPELALFHLLNLARQQEGHVLMTSSQMPSTWGVKLPDLVSRLQAFPVVTIESPDDALLRGVLVKHFSDRQIAVDESLLAYMLGRMPRSLAAARELVALIDAASLEQNAAVTRPFVGRILQTYQEPDLRNGDV